MRTYTQNDMSVSILRVALSAAGPLGAVIGEFATQLIPRQRLERLGDVVDILNSKVADVHAFQRKLESSAAFAALLEDGTRLAVHSPSREKRERITTLIVQGLNKDEIELQDQQALLGILGQLNDVQILVLIYYGSFKRYFGNPEIEAFQQKHSGVLLPEWPHSGMSAEASAVAQAKVAMYAHYVSVMVGFGLLSDTEGMARSSGHRRVEITRLGKMLLRAIGQPVADH